MIWALMQLAFGGNLHLVHSGETVETLSENDPVRMKALREANGLGEGAEPAVGAVLELPWGDASGRDGLVLTVSGTGTATIGGLVGALAENLPLPPGSLVCTDPGGYATVRLAALSPGGPHDDITLMGGTCVVIAASVASAAGRESLVELKKGTVSVRAAVGADAGVILRSPAGITEGRAGGFRVTLEDSATRTEAVGGAVAVIGAGVEKRLKAGEGSRTKKGEAPSDPVPLLLPGTPTFPAEGSVLRRPDFSWTDNDRALSWRIEVSATDDFSRLVLVDDVEATTWTPERLFLPYRLDGLWWRISGVDRLGFVGLPSEGRSLRVPPGMGT